MTTGETRQPDSLRCEPKIQVSLNLLKSYRKIATKYLCASRPNSTFAVRANVPVKYRVFIRYSSAFSSWLEDVASRKLLAE